MLLFSASFISSFLYTNILLRTLQQPPIYILPLGRGTSLHTHKQQVNDSNEWVKEKIFIYGFISPWTLQWSQHNDNPHKEHCFNFSQLLQHKQAQVDDTHQKG
jgi:hypothetical protein